MGPHMWVEMKYTLVEAELQEGGDIAVFATETQLEASNEDAKYGCWHCAAPLNEVTIKEECPNGTPVQ